MNKELIKKVLTIVFAVALLSAIIGFVGLIFLNARFVQSYYIYSSAFTTNTRNAFKSNIPIVIALLSVAVGIVIALFVLGTFNFTSDKSKKVVGILQICLISVIIVLSITSIVLICVLGGKNLQSSYSSYYGYSYRLELEGYYDSLLSQSLSATIPLIVAGVIALGKAIFDFVNFLKIKKSETDFKEMEENL